MGTITYIARICCELNQYNLTSYLFNFRRSNWTYAQYVLGEEKFRSCTQSHISTTTSQNKFKLSHYVGPVRVELDSEPLTNLNSVVCGYNRQICRTNLALSLHRSRYQNTKRIDTKIKLLVTCSTFPITSYQHQVHSYLCLNSNSLYQVLTTLFLTSLNSEVRRPNQTAGFAPINNKEQVNHRVRSSQTSFCSILIANDKQNISCSLTCTAFQYEFLCFDERNQLLKTTTTWFEQRN